MGEPRCRDVDNCLGGGWGRERGGGVQVELKSGVIPRDRKSGESVSLVGLVVKASASGAEDQGFESRLRRDFSGSSHTSDLKIGTPVATLSGSWHYRVSAGTGRLGVSIL